MVNEFWALPIFAKSSITILLTVCSNISMNNVIKRVKLVEFNGTLKFVEIL